MELPELGGEAGVGEEALQDADGLRGVLPIEAVAIPVQRERPHLGQGDAFASGWCGFLRPKERDRASSEHDVVPESHAQFAHHLPRSDVTLKSVGSAENGSAMRISPTHAGRSSSTSMCRSCSSRSNRSTSTSSPTAPASVARLGVVPV